MYKHVIGLVTSIAAFFLLGYFLIMGFKGVLFLFFVAMVMLTPSLVLFLQSFSKIKKYKIRFVDQEVKILATVIAIASGIDLMSIAYYNNDNVGIILFAWTVVFVFTSFVTFLWALGEDG